MQGSPLANGTEKHAATNWNVIDWHQQARRVRNLRQRIFRATQAGEWKRVRSLQKLMLRSHANRVVSMRRVAQLNTGKWTPGVDKVLLKTPEARGRMVDHLAHYQPWAAKPARRVYIAKSNGKLRPLGIPIWASYCLSFQGVFGILSVVPLVDRGNRSTIRALLYHMLPLLTSTTSFPVSLDRLAQLRDDFWSERNPARATRASSYTLQLSRITPISNGRDVDIQQFCCGQCRVAPIATLSRRTDARTLGTRQGNVVGIANPFYFADGKRTSHPCSGSGVIEQGGNLGIRVGGSQFTYTQNDFLAGLAHFPRLFVTRDRQVGKRLCLPANVDGDEIATLGEGDIFDQPTHELFALGERRGRCKPDGGQVLGQCTNLLSLRSREQQSCLPGQRCILALQLFDPCQFLVPVALQASCDQAIVWIHHDIPTSGEIGFILRTFNLTAPLLIDLPGTRLKLPKGSQRDFQVCRLDGFQEALLHCLVNAISPHGLTGLGRQLGMSLATFVDQQRAIALIPDAHASPTGATQDDPLQQRWAFTHGSAMFTRIRGPVVSELLLVSSKLLPGDVAGMDVQQHNGPILLLHPACVTLDARLFSWERLAAGLGTPVDVGACVHRAVQDIQHPPIAQSPPHQFFRVRPSPQACGKAQVVLGKMTDYRECRAMLLKEREDESNGLLHCLVRIKHDVVSRIVHQSYGQAKAQLAFFSLGQLSALQALPQPMQFRFAHGAFEAQQQTIIVQSRIVDALLVDDQRVGERTDLQQAIPVAARTSQARDFQAQHGTNVSETDLGHQELKSIPAQRGGTRLSLILVNHLNGRAVPTQITGPLHEIVLAGGTASILPHLQQGRLAHIDDCLALQVVRTDFVGIVARQHEAPPFQNPRRAYLQRRASMLSEPTIQSHGPAGQPRAETRPEQARPVDRWKMVEWTPLTSLSARTQKLRQVFPSYLLSFWEATLFAVLLYKCSDVP